MYEQGTIIEIFDDTEYMTLGNGTQLEVAGWPYARIIILKPKIGLPSYKMPWCVGNKIKLVDEYDGIRWRPLPKWITILARVS